MIKGINRKTYNTHTDFTGKSTNNSKKILPYVTSTTKNMVVSCGNTNIVKTGK